MVHFLPERLYIIKTRVHLTYITKFLAIDDCLNVNFLRFRHIYFDDSQIKKKKQNLFSKFRLKNLILKNVPRVIPERIID